MGILVAGLCGMAQASLTIYNTRADWRQAATGQSVNPGEYVYDFNGLGTQYINTTPFDFGPFIATHSHGDGLAGEASIDMDGFVFVLNDYSWSVTVQFDAPVYSFGFDVTTRYGGNERLNTITTSAEDSTSLLAFPASDYFFGLVSTVAITSITMTSDANTQMLTDNWEAGSAIPEPASALMIGFGAAVITLIRRFYGRA